MDDLSTDAAALTTPVSEVPVAGPDEALGEVRDRLVGAPRLASAADVVVLDGDRLVGLVRIEDLLAAPADTVVAAVMDADPPVLAPDTNQERAAWKAVEHGQGALAVVDSSGRFVGLVPPWRMLAVLLREHDEDLARLGGYLAETEAARSAMTESVVRRFWHRLPWLLVGLLASMVAAALVGGFERSLEADLALAFFIPGVVYMADAVGTQTEALVVRGLSVGVSVAAVVRRELVTGTLMGLALAAVAFPLASVLADGRVALTVSVAIWAACAVATTVAMGLPWLLHRLGQDPAFGSGPLATVLQDLLSLVIYFSVAQMVL